MKSITMRIITCLLLLLPIYSHAESYLCIADKASGFKYSSSDWETVTFTTDNKYVIKASGVDRFPIQVNIVGDKVPVIMCKKDINTGGFLHCESAGPLDMLGIARGESFTFNQKSLRFMRVVPRGYINVVPGNQISDSSSGTPFIEIGKCSQI